MSQHPPTDLLEQHALDRARDRSQDGGVWRRSTDRAYVIFCVGQEDAKIRRFLKWALGRNLGFKPLRGCYQGIEERSFIVNVADLPEVMPFIAGQETILLLHDYNRADVPRATLIYLDTGRRRDLGLFVMGNAKVKDTHESWTFDPLTGVYYTTQPL